MPSIWIAREEVTRTPLPAGGVTPLKISESSRTYREPLGITRSACPRESPTEETRFREIVAAPGLPFCRAMATKLVPEAGDGLAASKESVEVAVGKMGIVLVKSARVLTPMGVPRR